MRLQELTTKARRYEERGGNGNRSTRDGVSRRVNVHSVRGRLFRYLLIPLSVGVVFTALYDRLLFLKLPTTAYHSIAASALSPANDFVLRHLDPECRRGPSWCYSEILFVNALLYAFWSFVLVVCNDLLRRISQKHRHSGVR